MQAVCVGFPNGSEACAEATAVPVSTAADQGLARVCAWAHADCAAAEAQHPLTGNHTHLIAFCASGISKPSFELLAA